MNRSKLGVCFLWAALLTAADWEKALEQANYLRDTSSPLAEAEYRKVEALAASWGEVARAIVWNDMALLMIQQGRFGEAEPLLRTALAVHERNKTIETVNFAKAAYHFGLTQRAKGNRIEAEAFLNRSLDLIERIEGPNSLKLVAPLGALSAVYVDFGKLNEARALVRREMEISTQLGKDHPVLVARWVGLSEIERLSGEYEAARRAIRNALRILEASPVLDEPAMAAVYNQRARLAYEMGSLRQAAEDWNRSLQLLSKHRQDGDEEILLIKSSLARIEIREKRYRTAEQSLIPIIRMAESKNLKMIFTVALHSLGAMYLQQKQFERAEPLLTRSLSIADQELGSSSTESAHCLRDLVIAHLGRNRVEDAERFSRRAVQIAETEVVVSMPWLDLLELHANVLKRMKRVQEAAAMQERVRVLTEGRPSMGHTVDVTELQPGSQKKLF